MSNLKPKSSSECVKVVVRCRPMNSKETQDGYERVVEMNPTRGIIEIHNPSASKTEPPKTFTFDSVYDWNSKQQDLYDETFRDLVQSVLEGFNGTIFAYGQTGTGKTYTMQGVKNDVESRGVVPNSFEHIFQHIARTENEQYLVRASYLEIYLEEVKDLLSKDHTRRLELKERPDTGVYVKDLSSFVTKSVKEIEHVMNVGNQNRATGPTNMNEHSSRSHAIFIVTIECSQVGLDNENHIRVGKLNMVDLAGSERQAKTGSTGDRLKEATKINLSLSALGNVISALIDGKSSHIPYRDSKLTRLLQDSLGGNAKTVMVANIGPASYNYEESLTTLRYANRAKNIKNKPKINEDPKDALLREFQEEIARLRGQLSKDGPKNKKKHRRRKGPDGEILEGSEGESDEAEEGDVDDYMKEQQQKLDEEKDAILNDQSLIAEEKDKLLNAMQEKEERLAAERAAKEALSAKIKAMESKLLCGGRNIVDHTNEQQRALEQRRKEILEQQRKEREIQQELDQKEDMALEWQRTYHSLQDEVKDKTKKLRKLYTKLHATKQEIQDLQEAHSSQRQELEQTQNELTRELKLKMLIIENFIPPEEKNKIMNRAYLDEDDDEDMWKLQPLTRLGNKQMAQRPVSAVGNRRPVSEYARMAAAMGGNPRFKGENILTVELDMPNRTTRDYEGPTVAPRVQAALDAALQDEEDIDIEDRPETFNRRAKVKLKQKEADMQKIKSSKLVPDFPMPGSSGAGKHFPSSRGLVRK